MLALILCATFEGGNTLGEDGVVKKEDSKETVTFSPEIENKLAEFFNKLRDAKRTIWRVRMTREIAEVAKVTGLRPEVGKALEKVAEKAVDASVGPWSAKMEEFFRNQWQPEQIPSFLEQILSQVDAYAENDYGTDYVPPFEHPLWQAGLEETLTAEQAGIWQKTESDRRQATKREIAEFLKPNFESTREQVRLGMANQAGDIRSTLTLPSDRAGRLEALAKTVADETASRARDRAEKILLRCDDPQRRQILKNGHYYLGPDQKDLELQETAWSEAVAHTLGPEDLKRWQDIQGKQKAIRDQALARAMIAELDRTIAFTASQRERLEPIAERLIKGHPMLSRKSVFRQFANYSPQLFFTAGAKATEEELKPILDAAQWKRWQDVCMSKKVVPRQSTVARAKPSEDSREAPRPLEPEEVEDSLSDYLYDKTTKERKRMLTAMTLKAEDAGRVAKLDSAVMGRLLTAARGATEEYLLSWKTSTEENLRSQVANAAPQNVKQLLEGMENQYYGRNDLGLTESKQPVWDSTLKATLTESQEAAWKKELEARKAYRDRTVLSLAMAGFARINSLSADQWEKLEPMVAAVLKEYGEEISRFFSPVWHLQSHSALIPFAGVPEKDFKAILRNDQWERWTATPEFTNSTNYWTNIQQNHEQMRKARK